MELSELTSVKQIKFDLKSNTKEGVIKELAELLLEEGKINSIDVYLNDVLAREKEYSTGIGQGIAIPHGKSDGVNEATIAIGRCKDIEWGSLDDKPVKFVILIAVPKSGANRDHLMILAKIAESLMDNEFTSGLLGAKSKLEIYDLISKTA
ncbi:MULTISPECIES: PTS sugar transporter subunit IIA [Clostridium]|uniref:PTS sugar transporter subunit IIA n=1 Tax=Clostridium frigoriphilum TaxID=443253 RepID=A0ABU7UUS2_9CLOT|nr:PTS sugar transporter subunit IIA [Clostridium sp. DSM 17811]MBU3101984.1 PTS sugar transporter subunit IIA [Clostridium sp. DSM 17811]